MTAIRYRITPHAPAAHLYEVVLTIDKPSENQRLWLPVWIPGSYLVREFARHIVELCASSGGAVVGAHKVDKHTWQLDCSGREDSIEVRTIIYAWDLSVRAAHLDHSHGFFNGPSVFLAVDGRTDQPVEVHIAPPSDARCVGWRVATTLPAIDVNASGHGRYQADNYDHLIDHPVEMGTFERVLFHAGGSEHEMAITGRVRHDAARLAHDLTAICNEQIRMFHGDGPPPFARYLFLTTALGDAYGGLEHKDSTALLCKRDDLAKPGMKEANDGYRAFLGLCSHEYFHLWNVKRIKPAAFTPYDLKQENYTSLLWAFEGITSYYDDLFLVRAGVITAESYLDLLGKTLTRVARTPGRQQQTLADASFDAWIKYYRADENAVNSQMSYYVKGSIAALMLDLLIREHSHDKKSLDDVMRVLWQRHGATGVGVGESTIEAIASEVAGSSLQGFFDKALRSTAELEPSALLAGLGVVLHRRVLEGEQDQGGKPGSRKVLDPSASLGATLGSHDFGAVLSTVLTGSSAQHAGLSAGDVVVAVDGLHVNKGGLTKVLGDRSVGDVLHVHAFRRDELLEFKVVLQPAPKDAIYLTLVDEPEVATRRRLWLGDKHRRDQKDVSA
jgi:predicted metalloprotease with PDZ domain